MYGKKLGREKVNRHERKKKKKRYKTGQRLVKEGAKGKMGGESGGGNNLKNITGGVRTGTWVVRAQKRVNRRQLQKKKT